MIIPSKSIKIAQRILVSPHYEIIVDIVYIVSFFMLTVRYISSGNFLSNYKTNQLVNRGFKIDTLFDTIETEDNFFDFVDFLVNKLYVYQPEKSIQFFVPFGSIRLLKFANNPSLCSEVINFKNICDDYKCTLETLNEIYGNSLCGFTYKKNRGKSSGERGEPPTKFKKIIRKFEGKFTSYDLYDGEIMDFTINDYDKEKMKAFVDDPDLRFIVLMWNIYIPRNDNYVFCLAGVEMVNYFHFPVPIFTSSIYSNLTMKNTYFLVVYIIFFVSVILSSLKLIYELNVKYLFSIHEFMVIHEIVNVCYIIFLFLGVTATNEENFIENNLIEEKFQDHIGTVMLKSYNEILISILFIFIPFKFISLLSWLKISFPIVHYLRVIFRIIPGLLVMGLICILLLLMFTTMDFFLFNSNVYGFRSLFTSLCSIFNLQLIDQINQSEALSNSISANVYFLLFNCLEVILIFFFFCILVNTSIHLIKTSIKYEKEKEKSAVVEKLEEVSKKFDEEHCSVDNNIFLMKKQILWLSLGVKKDSFQAYSDYKNLILFKKASQVISFFKYLFAIKPDMQFRYLHKKFGIIMECKTTGGLLKEEDLKEVDDLLDWLNYFGCKIPVVLFTNEKIERTLKMKIASFYQLLRFIYIQSELTEFIDETSQDDEENDEEEEKNKKDIFGNVRVRVESFTLYPVQIIYTNSPRELIGEDSILKLNTSQASFHLPPGGKAFKRMLSSISASSRGESFKGQIGIFDNKTLDKSNSLRDKTKRNTFLRLKTIDKQNSILPQINQSISEEKSRVDEEKSESESELSHSSRESL